MAQPFGVGDVVGGRYRITHHVVTSADQDIIFQAVDQVLDREVSVLLASRSNAKQVATSAKELATGERSSGVQVLDLGLAEERTYLISSIVDPNELLDLVVPDSAPYVEPYFTDSLGSELFGQSRQMQPQTYDDDAEYYARLQADLAGSSDTGRKIPGLARRRPAFLDKVTAQHAESHPHQPVPGSSGPQQGSDPGDLQAALDQAEGADRLQPSPQMPGLLTLATDLDEVAANPRADDESDVVEAIYAWVPKADSSSPEAKTPMTEARAGSAPAGHRWESGTGAPSSPPAEGPIYESAPSAPISTVSVGSSEPVYPPVEVDQTVADGEEVIDDPPQQPDPSFDPPAEAGGALDSFGSGTPPQTQVAPTVSPPASLRAEQDAATFTGLISAVPSHAPASFPAPEVESAHPLSSSAAQEAKRPSTMWWIAAAVLAVLVVAAAIILFTTLNGS